MKLSVIIPTLNEAENITALVRRLGGKESRDDVEIIVVDGGSEDETVRLAKEAGACVHCNGTKGRALQMNYGAEIAKGNVLYFVHGDTLPMASYRQDIQESLEAGYPVGCYRYQFDSSMPLLKVNGFFTRFNFAWCRGGDQSLFIKKEVFEAMGGFDPQQVIMEDFEFLKRLKGKYPFRIIPKSILVSARKYENNGYLRVQVANLVAFNMFRFGFTSEKIARTYKRLLDHRG